MFKRYLLILVLGLLLATSAVQAQDSLPPVIAVSDTDFYAINPADGSVKQLTDHHQRLYSDQPRSQRDLAISPDGRYLAYRQTPDFFIQAVHRNEIGNYGESPSDIMLLDLTTGQERAVVQHRGDVKDSLQWWYRSSLAWSADSTRLVYFQNHISFDKVNRTGQIISFNVVTNQWTTLSDGIEPIWRLRWSGDAILADTRVYTAAGSLVSRYFLNDGMTTNYSFPYHGNDYVMVDSADVIPHKGQEYVMNMLTGEWGVVDGYQSSISALSPENSLVFIKDDNDTRPSYVINPKTGDKFTPPKQAPYAVDFTFAPDGQHFAYILLNTSVNIANLSGKEVVADFKADTIIWSPKQYTIADLNGDQSAPVISTTDFDNTRRCGTLPVVPLVVGGQGRVIVGGGSNRLRSAPGPDAEKIGQIPEGAIFNVVNGQQNVCEGGIRWAQVEYQGVTGWTAQGTGGKLFLEAVQ